MYKLKILMLNTREKYRFLPVLTKPRSKGFVIYEFPPLGGGASPVSYGIAKGYVGLGHNVTVVTMGFGGLKDFEVKDGTLSICLNRLSHVL